MFTHRKQAGEVSSGFQPDQSREAAMTIKQDGLITITAGKRDNTISLSFRDQGRGFTEEALKNLFKPFSPGEQHIDENVGLDLALAKMIMDAHSGMIRVGNNPESGAFVTLEFAI